MSNQSLTQQIVDERKKIQANRTHITPQGYISSNDKDNGQQ